MSTVLIFLKSVYPRNPGYGLTGLTFILFGYGFYLSIRQFDPLSLGIAIPRPDDASLSFISNTLLGSLPSFLHVIGFTLITLSYTALTRQYIVRYTGFWLFANLCFEIAQGAPVSGSTLLPGTFDSNDILSIFLGAAILFLLLVKRHDQQNVRVSDKPFYDILVKKFRLVGIYTVGILCLTGSVDMEYEAEPVYLGFDELRQPLVVQEQERITGYTNYLHYESYLFINEDNKGIHVLETAENMAPQYIAFLVVQGNRAMHVKDGYLYADNFVDLLTIDISDKNNFHIAHRTEDVFPNNPFQVIGSATDLTSFDETRGVVIDTKLTQTPVSEDKKYVENRFGSVIDIKTEGDLLYAIVDDKVLRFDISEPTEIASLPNLPTYKRAQYEGKIDSLTPVDGYIVTQTSDNRIDIYDSTTLPNPDYTTHYTLPESYRLLEFSEGRAFGWKYCRNCTDEDSHLTLFTLEDILNPTEERSIDMDVPTSIALENDYLFTCHKREDLIVNQLRTDGESETIETGHDIFCAEVTTNHNRVFIKNDRGITQYDYSVTPFRLEGTIRFERF